MKRKFISAWLVSAKSAPVLLRCAAIVLLCGGLAKGQAAVSTQHRAMLSDTVAVKHNVRSQVRYHWRDSFSATQQEQLQSWLYEYVAALESLVGELPFTLHIYLHRYDSSGGPVPWGQTQRGRRQGVILHVNPAFIGTALREDWTAPHELSHLIIPYLGRQNSWFAEGFASYMQYQVMIAAGVMSAAEAYEKYMHRFQRAEGKYDMHGMPFSEAAPKLREKRQFPTMYWGGAVYFWRVDQVLRARDTTLVDVLAAYVRCCRRNSGSLDRLVRDLDRVSESKVFSNTLDQFRNNAGFPEYAD